jgi:hypothetical protein
MIKVNVFVLLVAGNWSEVVERWVGEFPTVPRVDDYITNSPERDAVYQVTAVALGNGIPEPVVFCVVASISLPDS